MATDDRERDRERDDDSPNPVPLTSPPRKAPAPQPSADDLPADPEELRAMVLREREGRQKASRESAERRQRLAELERAEEERKAATLSEDQKAARARQEAERRAAESERKAEDAVRALDELKLERLVESKARAMKFENPEIAYRLIDRARVVRDEESGDWDGIEKALEKLAKEYPNLLAQKRPGPGSPPRDEHPGNPARRRAGDDGREAPVSIEQELRRKVRYPA